MNKLFVKELFEIEIALFIFYKESKIIYNNYKNNN